jgi:hypothetical protein
MRLQPSGAYAAYLLGLLKTMPLKLVFLTDGAVRAVWIGERQIILKPGSHRNMASVGRISGLVIQALRHLRQSNIDEQTIKDLRARLSSEECNILMIDAPYAPAWIARILRRIAKNPDREM